MKRNSEDFHFFYRCAVILLIFVFAAGIGGCPSNSENQDNDSGNDDPADDDDDNNDSGLDDDDAIGPRIDASNDVFNEFHYDFSVVTKILEGYGLAGMGVALSICTADRILYEGYFGGYAEDTVSPILSASKIPSDTVIMTMVDDGLFGLDDLVGDYLDFWPEDKAEITVRHLLSHTSGIPNLAMCLVDDTITLDECARQIADMPIQAPPGTTFLYGGTGLQVVGRMAEIVAGKSWREIFRERLAEDVGLEYYDFTGKDNPPLASGAMTNLMDYTRILQLHLGNGVFEGKRILSEDLVKEMQMDHLVEIGGSTSFRYGIGWWILPTGGFLPPTQFHDAGGYGSLPWMDIDRGYVAFIHMGQDLNTGWNLYYQIQPLIIEQFDLYR